MFSMKRAMWSCFSSPLSRMRWATWLAVCSYSAHVTVRPDGSKISAAPSGSSAALSAAYTGVPFPHARVEHVDQARAHERQRLILQVVTHEADGHAVGGIGETDLPPGAHVAEGTVVRTVHRRQVRDHRRRFERVPHGPTRGDAHDGVAPAHLFHPDPL